MAYYNTCPWCGASLDPGESCDCKKNPMQPELTSENQTIHLKYITKMD